MKKTLTILWVMAVAWCTCHAQTNTFDALMDQAAAYSKQKEYGKSNECYEQIIASLKGTPREHLIPSIQDFIAINELYLGVNAMQTKDYTTAKGHLDQAIAKSQPGGKTSNMAHSWMGNWYGMQSFDIRTAHGDAQQALALSLEAEKFYGLAHAQEKQLKERLTRAGLLRDLLRNEEAEVLLKQIVKECEGVNTRDYLRGQTLYMLGCIEKDTERFQQALLHLEEAYRLCDAATEPTARNHTYLCAFALENLYKNAIPDAKKATLWQQRAEAAAPERMNGTESDRPETFTAKNKEDVKEYQANVQKYTRAIQLIVAEKKEQEGVNILTELISQNERKTGFSQTRLADYYSARALGHQHLRQYGEAKEDVGHALTLLKMAGDAARNDLTNAWMQMSQVEYYMGNKDKAIMAADSCVQTALEYYGPLHSETLDAYKFRSNLAGFANNATLALSDRKSVFDIIQKNVEKNFAYLTTAERTAYWNKYQPDTNVMFAFAQKLNENNSAFTDDLFNQQLLAKGLLLTAESALQRAIDNDDALSNTYQQIRALRKKATDDKTLPTEAYAATLEADRLERSLSESASTLHQFLNFLQVHTDDVRSKLTGEDVAIEFVDYQIGKDSTMYAALLLSPQWEHVRFLPLLEHRELADLPNEQLLQVWQPILDILPDGVKNIYFAPSGMLYQLPIESQKMANGQMMSEVYHMYRLSSTRWLAIGAEQTEGKDAVIYGGLAYDTSVENMKKDASRYPQQRGMNEFGLNLREAIKEIPYLPGTKTEAESIAKTINKSSQKGLHAEMLLADRGTEASFKNLDGRFKRIIHIATHGFYQPNDSAKVASSAINVLDRCGLFFAGAENKYMGEKLPEGVEDGILTAQEISSLDLRGLDLVTLSACQTAQGDITSDGVFGLQRGFKKAGANSILMSLWKVDDEATGFLMAEFYKYWMAGKNKHEALELAKEAVRSQTKWQNPQYWTAFILLDALD